MPVTLNFSRTLFLKRYRQNDMSLLIPLRSDLDHYQETVTLDEVSFDFVFRWNNRDDCWYLSIFDPTVAEAVDGSRIPIIGSIPVLVGWALLAQYRMRERPLGDLVAFDTSGQELDPGRRDLGSRVLLIYYTAAEIAARAPS